MERSSFALRVVGANAYLTAGGFAVAAGFSVATAPGAASALFAAATVVGLVGAFLSKGGSLVGPKNA